MDPNVSRPLVWQTSVAGVLDLLESEESARASTHEGSYRKQVLRLKQLLAEKILEVDFFQGALQEIEARRRKSGASGETASTSKSEK